MSQPEQNNQGTAEGPVFEPSDFVYAGRRILKGGKIGVAIHRINDALLAVEMVFNSKHLQGNVIGGIYRGASFSTSQADGLGNAKYVGRWENAVDLIGWRARDEAIEADTRLAKLVADAKKLNELETLLLPLRKLYATYTRQYDNAGKESLEQALIRALRSPPRKSELVPTR